MLFEPRAKGALEQKGTGDGEQGTGRDPHQVGRRQEASKQFLYHLVSPLPQNVAVVR
jgi:hypothetical protein